MRGSPFVGRSSYWMRTGWFGCTRQLRRDRLNFRVRGGLAGGEDDYWERAGAWIRGRFKIKLVIHVVPVGGARAGVLQTLELALGAGVGALGAALALPEAGE